MEQTSLSRSSKWKRLRLRYQKEDASVAVDRLSELPESLITHILSFLEMKDSVRTSALAKSWKHRWTHVDSIVYHLDDSQPPSEERLERFMLFVDRTLMQCTSPKLKKFSLTSCFMQYGFRDNSLLFDKWICFFLRKKVEVLQLGLEGLQGHRFPDCFYQCSSLTSLEIEFVGEHYYFEGDEEYYDYTRLCWNRLQFLSLKRLTVTKRFMDQILSGCPVLETLILDTTVGLSTLKITSPSLTELRLRNCYWDSEYGNINLKINAPWVKKLEISGEFNCFDCDLVCVRSLKSANLTLTYGNISHVDSRFYDDGGGDDLMSDNMIDKLLIPVRNVDDLVIGAELLQAVSLLHLTEETDLLFQCKNLTIQSPICIHEVPGIVCLLESSPDVETLLMRVMPWQCDLSRYEGFKYGHYIKEAFTSFNAVDYLGEQKQKFTALRNLKIDRRENLDACDENECFELEIAAYIIKHSPFLEKLVILCSESNSSKCVPEYCSILTSKLKVGEKAVQWELKKTNTAYEFIFPKKN